MVPSPLGPPRIRAARGLAERLPSRPVDTVLSVASRAALDACTRLGLDTDALLRAAGLERAAVMDPETRLPAARADALWSAAFAAARDPAFALHAAEALPFGAYRTVDFLCAHSPCVRDAYRRVAEFFQLVDVRARIEVDDEARTLTMLTVGGDPVPPPAQEYTFAALVSRMAVCVGPGWSPREVEFAFAPIPNPREHERVLRAPVSFGAGAPRLRFSVEAWETPVSGANPALLAVLEDHAPHPHTPAELQ